MLRPVTIGLLTAVYATANEPESCFWGSVEDWLKNQLETDFGSCNPEQRTWKECKLIEENMEETRRNVKLCLERFMADPQYFKSLDGATLDEIEKLSREVKKIRSKMARDEPSSSDRWVELEDNFKSLHCSTLAKTRSHPLSIVKRTQELWHAYRQRDCQEALVRKGRGSKTGTERNHQPPPRRQHCHQPRPQGH